MEDELGKGEISQVRKARWIKKNMEVAIKFIPKFKACSEYYERYLPLELQALLVTRSHPFIVSNSHAVCELRDFGSIICAHFPLAIEKQVSTLITDVSPDSGRFFRPFSPDPLISRYVSGWLHARLILLHLALPNNRLILTLTSRKFF